MSIRFDAGLSEDTGLGRALAFIKSNNTQKYFHTEYRHADFVTTSLLSALKVCLFQNVILVLFDIYPLKERTKTFRAYCLYVFYVVGLLLVQNIVCVTEYNLNELKRHWLFPFIKGRTRLDRCIFKQPAPPFGDAKKVARKMLFIGSNKPNKRVDRLKRLVDVTPEHCFFSIVGLSLSSQNPAVVSRQFISKKELEEELRSCDILVCTSDDEGFCYPVYDALRVGKTVLAFNLPVFQELYCGYKNLILFETENDLIRYYLSLTSEL